MKAKSAFRDASVLLLQLETPLSTAQAAAEIADAAGARVILNPAPAQALTARLLEGLYLLTPNETEAHLLTGVTVDSEETAAQAAWKLLARGVQNVIITMGARGAFVASEGIRQFIPSYKVSAVDATGAGDVFNGSLAVAIGEGKSLLEAAAFANAAAALSVMRLGAQASAPTRKEIDQFLASRRVQRTAPCPDFAPGRNGSNGWSAFPARPARKSLKMLAEL
jgi:ribokinase